MNRKNMVRAVARMMLGLVGGVFTVSCFAMAWSLMTPSQQRVVHTSLQYARYGYAEVGMSSTHSDLHVGRTTSSRTDRASRPVHY